MTKILFTHSYFYRFDPKQWKTAQPYPPYGTMYAAAVMRECGFGVKIFDTALRHSPSELLPVLAEERPQYLVIYDDGFNYLTKMCLTRMREAAFEMARMGKAAGCTVIVNSSDSTDHWEQYLTEGADFVILGEGEQTLRELIVALDGGRRTAGSAEPLDFSSILGITYKSPVASRQPPAVSRPPSAVHRQPSAVHRHPASSRPPQPRQPARPGLGFGGFGAVPPDLAAGARLLVAQPRYYTRLSLQVQLVRQAHLRQPLQLAQPGARGCRN